MEVSIQKFFLSYKDRTFVTEASDINFKGESEIILINEKTKWRKTFRFLERKMTSGEEPEIASFLFKSDDGLFLRIFND